MTAMTKRKNSEWKAGRRIAAAVLLGFSLGLVAAQAQQTQGASTNSITFVDVLAAIASVVTLILAGGAAWGYFSKLRAQLNGIEEDVRTVKEQQTQVVACQFDKRAEERLHSQVNREAQQTRERVNTEAQQTRTEILGLRSRDSP